MNIIVVEDEIRGREGIIKLIAKLNKGDRVIGEAENGLKGLELIRQLLPDVVITDIKMPELDGLEMLQLMYEEGLQTKAMVLSAYSEFEYARQAMKLGVTEYLLKPLTLPMFSQALENVRFQVTQEKEKTPDVIGTQEQIFRDILYGNIQPSREIELYLNNRFAINMSQPLALICVYLGGRYKEAGMESRKTICHMLLQKPEASYCIVDMEHYKSLVVLLYNSKEYNSLERWLQLQMLNHRLSGSLGWVESESIGHLHERFQALYPYMDWNVALEDEILVSFPKIIQIQTAPCIYPIDLENRMKAAICLYDWNKMAQLQNDFHHYFTEKIYLPREIKECYVRFCWAILTITKELNCINQNQVEQERLLELIMNAKSKQELLLSLELLFSWLDRRRQNEEEPVCLNVKLAKSMIHEFYQSGITLEEIADSLNLTPEYLGSQFHKEIGMNFSAYIREYRLNKAKELLCATQLKLYQIADKVGYSNPKYFSQVFKEYTGMLPAEYRKIIK